MIGGARAAGVLAAALLTVAGAGCGSGSGAKTDTPATPAGFKAVKADDFTFAVPSGWSAAAPRDEDGGQFVESRPPGTDVNRAQLRVGSKRGSRSDIDGAVQLVLADIPTRRPGARRVVLKSIDVPGASAARRVEFSVPGGGGLDPARIVTVLALTNDQTLVNLSMGLAESQSAEVRVDDIVRSLSVG